MMCNSEEFLLTKEKSNSIDENGHLKNQQEEEDKIHIVWENVLKVVYLHFAAMYGLYLAITSAKWLTLIFALLLYQAGMLGITAGAHRLWSHRSYKAVWQLRLLLIIFNTLAHQNSIIEWATDHRVHHKYSETNADPHNAKRGFFFAHVGWLLSKKHPDVVKKLQKIDSSDLTNDPMLAFQKRYFLIVMPITLFIVPTMLPYYLWNETLVSSYHVAFVLRYVCSLNTTWFVNSYAHLNGDKPYDKSINPGDNKFMSVLVQGEAYHNYHHVFPWDYKAAEIGNSIIFDFATVFIDFCARRGWVYDLKTASPSLIKRRINRTGDGSHGDVWASENK